MFADEPVTVKRVDGNRLCRGTSVLGRRQWVGHAVRVSPAAQHDCAGL